MQSAPQNSWSRVLYFPRVKAKVFIPSHSRSDEKEKTDGGRERGIDGKLAIMFYLSPLTSVSLWSDKLDSSRGKPKPFEELKTHSLCLLAGVCKPPGKAPHKRTPAQQRVMAQQGLQELAGGLSLRKHPDPPPGGGSKEGIERCWEDRGPQDPEKEATMDRSYVTQGQTAKTRDITRTSSRSLDEINHT